MRQEEKEYEVIDKALYNFVGMINKNFDNVTANYGIEFEENEVGTYAALDFEGTNKTALTFGVFRNEENDIVFQLYYAQIEGIDICTIFGDSVYIWWRYIDNKDVLLTLVKILEDNDIDRLVSYLGFRWDITDGRKFIMNSVKQELEFLYQFPLRHKEDTDELEDYILRYYLGE